MIVGAITVIIAITIGVFVWQLTQPSALEKEMRPIELSAVQVERLADSFDDKIEKLEEEILPALAVGAPVTVTFTEEEATAKIIEQIDEANIPLDVKDIWVNFTHDEKENKDKVLILGKVDVGLELSAGLELEIKVLNGKPKIVVGKLHIGKGWGIPGAAKDAVANVIPSEEALTDMLQDLPIDMTDIQIEGSELTFSGVKI